MTLPDNFICRPYRGVSVQAWDGPLEEAAVRSVLLTREAYRRTEFVVLRSGSAAALVRVDCDARDALFNPIRSVEWLGGPDDCAYVESPDTDSACASALAEVALAQGKPICVVEGRYRHVNFIHRARPVEVTVVDVVPPSPSRLLDLARTALEIDPDLPAIRLIPKLFEIGDLAGEPDPGGHFLLPCHGSGAALGGTVEYLDQRPAAGDWTLVGCERSRQFHQWFYGKEPKRQVDLCPDRLTEAGGRAATAGPLLLRCCLLERGYRVEGSSPPTRRGVVPWGANLDEVRAALAGVSAPAE